MNKITFAVVVAGLTAASQASAQVITRANSVPPGQRPPAGMCRVWIDGVPAGRQPRPTSCAAARASAPANSIIVYGNDTPFPGRARGRFRDGNCDFERRGTNLGDIVFGLRTGRDADRDCDVKGARELGVWYPSGRDRDGNQVYTRRVRTADGRIVVERARRNSAGQMIAISTRNDGRVSDRRGDDRDRVAERARRDREHELKRARKELEKAAKRAEKARNRALDRDDDDDDDDDNGRTRGRNRNEGNNSRSGRKN